jgi:AraC-like DNA-binding protein
MDGVFLSVYVLFMPQTGFSTPVAPLVPVVDVTIREALRLRSWNYPGTIYSDWRVYWNDRPGATVDCADATHGIDPRHVVLIAPHARADLTMLRPLTHLYACFRIVAPSVLIERRAWRLAISPEEESCFRRMAHRLLAGEVDWQAGFELLRLISGAVARLPGKTWHRAGADARIGRAISRVERDLADRQLSSTLLAEESGLTPNSFARLFRQQTGASPRHYLLSRRLESAATRLVTTDASVEQVASETGFCDRYHLSRHFSATFGQGPATYRRQHRTPLC